MFIKDKQLILRNAVENSKIPFVLSLSKGERDFGMLNKWVSVWNPSMLRHAQHERIPYASTAVLQMFTSPFEKGGMRGIYLKNLP
jgi:hypothetical protein